MNPFRTEFIRYRNLLLNTLEQIDDAFLFYAPHKEANSIAVILKHLAGNLQSRFTDFLSTDGEKPWRDREGEFTLDNESRESLLKKFESAWATLETNVFSLEEPDLSAIVKIRGVEFTVAEALSRSLAHFSYHVGEIVVLAKHHLGDQWKYQSIPPGKTEEYNQNPTNEKPS